MCTNVSYAHGNSVVSRLIKTNLEINDQECRTLLIRWRVNVTEQYEIEFLICTYVKEYRTSIEHFQKLVDSVGLGALNGGPVVIMAGTASYSIRDTTRFAGDIKPLCAPQWWRITSNRTRRRNGVRRLYCRIYVFRAHART